MNQKCKTCANSRVIVSENGGKRVCCLSGGLDFLCMIGKVDRHTTPKSTKDKATEGDGQN